MKRLKGNSLLLTLPFSSGIAQESGKTLVSTPEACIFPAAGQAAEHQSKYEAECYGWIASNTVKENLR